MQIKREPFAASSPQLEMFCCIFVILYACEWRWYGACLVCAGDLRLRIRSNAKTSIYMARFTTADKMLEVLALFISLREITSPLRCK